MEQGAKGALENSSIVGVGALEKTASYIVDS